MNTDEPGATLAAGMTSHEPEVGSVTPSRPPLLRDAAGRFLPAPPGPPPIVEKIIVDGAWCARVSLNGPHAQGRTMLLSLDDWLEVAGIEPRWTVYRQGDGSETIGTHSAAPAWVIGKGPDDEGMIILARLLTRARPSQRVVYHRGHFDLRRRSLGLEMDPRWKPPGSRAGRGRKGAPRRQTAKAVLLDAASELAR